MKKLLFIAVLVLLVLAGCSNEEEKTSTENQKVVLDKTGEEEEEEEEVIKEAKEVETPKRSEEEIEKEGGLIEVGQTAEDPNGKVELMKIKDINETIKQGPLKIELINAKIFKRTDMSQESLNSINQFSQSKIDEKLSYIQLRYSVENTSDKDVSWGGLVNIVTDQKEQIDAFKEEFFLLNTSNQILGNVVKDYNQAFILDKPDVNKIRLIFDRIYEGEIYNEVAGEVEYEFSFD